MVYDCRVPSPSLLLGIAKNNLKFHYLNHFMVLFTIFMVLFTISSLYIFFLYYVCTKVSVPCNFSIFFFLVSIHFVDVSNGLLKCWHLTSIGNDCVHGILSISNSTMNTLKLLLL
uniref:Uncharacterized protein n=1 Tax=Rhizophora mucronata TaxID=61149 RepID=A0A2P2PC84_RHIMU